MARLIAVVVLAAAAGCCACGPKHTSEPKPPQPACGFSPATTNFTLNDSTERGKTVIAKLRAAAAVEVNTAATDPDFYKTDCQSQWSTMVIGLYCGDRLEKFCESSCTGDADRTTCKNDGRDPVINHCASQSLAAFRAAYAKCAPATPDASLVLRWQ